MNSLGPEKICIFFSFVECWTFSTIYYYSYCYYNYFLVIDLRLGRKCMTMKSENADSKWSNIINVKTQLFSKA